MSSHYLTHFKGTNHSDVYYNAEKTPGEELSPVSNTSQRAEEIRLCENEQSIFNSCIYSDSETVEVVGFLLKTFLF